MLLYLNINTSTANMSCFWMMHFPVVAVLLILPQVLVAEVNSTTCSSCYTGQCPEPCFLTCTQECPEKYYPSTLACEMHTTTSTTKRTTVTTTATTTTTTTTTTPMKTPTTTILTPFRSANETPLVQIPPQLANLSRSRRQASNETKQIQPPNEIPETAVPPVETTTLLTTSTILVTTPTTLLTTPTTTTTTKLPSVVCRLCSVESCTVCQDNSLNNPICAKCDDGFSLSDDMASCSKDGLSGGAIAGIVIGIFCFLAVVVVVIIFLVRRFGLSKDAADPEHAASRNGRDLNNTATTSLSNSTHKLRRQQDKNTRYSENPTFKNTAPVYNNDPEQYEVSKLGDAPPPPREDSAKRYDSPKPINQDDQHSYSPFKVKAPTEPGYVNMKGKQGNMYANTQKENTNGPSASDKPGAKNKTKDGSVSPDNVPVYEEINTTRPGNINEPYANAKAIADQFKKALNAEDTQQDYCNDRNVIIEPEYEDP